MSAMATSYVLRAFEGMNHPELSRHRQPIWNVAANYAELI